MNIWETIFYKIMTEKYSKTEHSTHHIWEAHQVPSSMNRWMNRKIRNKNSIMVHSNKEI